MKKSYFLLSIGIIQSLYSIGMFFESYEKYVDEYGGVSFDFNMNYLVWFICALLFTAYAYLLVKEEKVEEVTEV